MPSLIVRADDDTNERKQVKQEGLRHFAKMQQHKKPGDHIEVVETIQPGTYALGVHLTPEGHVSIDLTPGKES
jgi:hypothetical protein